METGLIWSCSYFTHGDYAGISAFVSSKASESERNARLIAVGILVPLSSGRLGQSWLHAQKTQDIAAYDLTFQLEHDSR